MSTETPVRFSWMAMGKGSSVSNSTRGPVTRDEALAIAINRFGETWGGVPTLVEVAPLDHPNQASYHRPAS